MRPGLGRGLVFGIPLGIATWAAIIWIIIEIITP